MNITITENQGTPPVTIMHLDGKLDGSNYESLVLSAKKLYAAGSRNLVLDLGKLTFLSSAGIAALHKVALLFRGEKNLDQLDQNEGWAAYREIDRDPGVQAHVKLVGPTQPVQRVLDLVGFSVFFEIHKDLQQATASFQPARSRYEGAQGMGVQLP